jgi:phosphoribosylformylglycinamidine cyclo-ligase
MVAVVGADGVDAALARLHADGVPAWVLGTVRADDAARGPDIIRGTKGVDGGAVHLHGNYRTA